MSIDSAGSPKHCGFARSADPAEFCSQFDIVVEVPCRRHAVFKGRTKGIG